MTPFIFKVIFTVFLALAIMANLSRVRKGEHIAIAKPFPSAISALIGLLFIVGIWVWL